jgi:hypothetical protein
MRCSVASRASDNLHRAEGLNIPIAMGVELAIRYPKERRHSRAVQFREAEPAISQGVINLCGSFSDKTLRGVIEFTFFFFICIPSAAHTDNATLDRGGSSRSSSSV